MWTKIYNLYRQVTARGQVTNEGYIPFFEGEHDDNFTLTWASIISKSPSAVSCLSTLCDFLEGAGFSGGSDLENKVVNSKGETFFQIHQKTVKEYAQNKGFYWLLRYDALSKVIDWQVLPFENCRLGKPDDTGYISKIYYNPFFGTNLYNGAQKNKTKIYDTYNPKAVREQFIKEGEKYKGQVFFYGQTNSVSRFYPINEAYSAHDWMKIEDGVSSYHQDNIDNGFLQKFMLIMKGDPNAASTNPEFTGDGDNPTTVAEEFDAVVEANFMGKGNHNNLMVQWLNNGDEEPKILPFPSIANGDLFITLDNQATKKITVAFKVPGVLANIQEGVSLGGDANQIRVSVKLMQHRVTKDQRVLTDAYSKILKNFSEPYNETISITPYNPYPELEMLDDKIWNALSTEEKRRWIQENTEIDLFEDDLLEEQPTQPQTATVKNAIPVGFPESVKKNVKKTLDYIDKMQIKCGGKAGRAVSEAIMNNQNMGFKQLKRIHSYLKAREKFANSAYSEGCSALEYHAWGGKEMFDFLEVKLKDIDQWLN